MNRLTRAMFAMLLAAVMLVVGAPSSEAVPQKVVSVGTSIELGVGNAAGESWINRLAARSPGSSFIDMSLGGGAYTAENELGDSIPKHVAAAIAQHPDMDTLILGAPVNDLVRLSEVSPLRWAVFNAVSSAQSHGIHVIVMAIWPFNDGAAFTAGWWASLESRRLDFNSWCAAMYGPDCVDVGWALHQTTSWRADDRWFRDGLHPTRIGAALAAEVFPLGQLY